MKNPLKILAVAAIAICFAFALPKHTERRVFNVVIDASHGGKDFGAVHGDIKEKDVVRKVAGKIAGLSGNYDVAYHFITEKDEFVSLQDRVKQINNIKPDLVLSLHCNATTKAEASGMEFFVSDKSLFYQRSTELATALSKRFEDKSYYNRGVKQAPFFVLAKSEAPAIHVELGFISNPDDRDYLTNDQKLNEMASVIVEFINDIK